MLIAFLALVLAFDVTPGPAKPKPTLLEEIKRVAKNAMTHPSEPWVKSFLEAAQHLPAFAPRVFFHTADKSTYYTEDEAAKLPEATRKSLVRRIVDEETYYARIADPTGYLRPLEILARAGWAPAGARLLDFGYGNIGQLKMLAALGADAVGIEVDPLLPKLYGKDVGPSGLGKVSVLHGYFPSDKALVAAVGKKYSLFLSKNTLKRGYVHPQVPVEPKKRIDLGSDDNFLTIVHDLLRPGGFFFIYNIGPAEAQRGKPYVQMADIVSPFDKAALERAGFEVLAFDVDDSKEVRAVGRLLEWDQGPDAMDLEHNIFSRYMLARRR